MRILLVEDEPDIAQPIVDFLRHAHYEAAWANNLSGARDAFIEREYDLVVLDIMLPEGEDAGLEFAEELRAAQYDGGILFLTARDTLDDRIRGLDTGGDDYLIKPFSLKELLARVRALLRRPAQTKTPSLERGALRVDFTNRTVNWHDSPIELSEREFAMLELFALYPERVFTVDELLDRFFPDADSGHRVVRVYVSQLRHKVDAAIIKTMTAGYKLGV